MAHGPRQVDIDGSGGDVRSYTSREELSDFYRIFSDFSWIYRIFVQSDGRMAGWPDEQTTDGPTDDRF